MIEQWEFDAALHAFRWFDKWSGRHVITVIIILVVIRDEIDEIHAEPLRGLPHDAIRIG